MNKLEGNIDNLDINTDDVISLIYLVDVLGYDLSGLYKQILLELGLENTEDFYSEYFVEVTRVQTDSDTYLELARETKEYKVRAINSDHAEKLAQELFDNEFGVVDIYESPFVDYSFEYANKKKRPRRPMTSLPTE